MFKGVVDNKIIGWFEITILLVVAYLALSYLYPHITGSITDPNLINNSLYYIYAIFLKLLPFAIVIWLGKMALKLWVHYIQTEFISKVQWSVLEIVPPREVLRSPKAMELFFTNALYYFGNPEGKDAYWDGVVTLWSSLEIASIDGQVHFYVRVPLDRRDLAITQMYAQFPQSQVREVEDYTLAVDSISPRSAWAGWGCEFKLAKPIAYPLKTYVDFGLDKDPKEEFKIDPISPVIELLGSIGKGEQMWMQILIRPAKTQYPNRGKPGTHDWVQEVEDQLIGILAPYSGVRKREDAEGQFSREIRPPPFLEAVVKGAGNKILKIGFDTGIRVCYVARKESFNVNNRKSMGLLFRQYESPYMNSFKSNNGTNSDAFNSYFMLSPKEVMELTERMITEYKERAFFHHPIRHQLLSSHNMVWPFNMFTLPFVHSETFVLNTEELATIWHFPGQNLQVPTLERIESKESSPPTNLPT